MGVMNLCSRYFIHLVQHQLPVCGVSCSNRNSRIVQLIMQCRTGHVSQMVYPPTGWMAKDREMSTHAHVPSEHGTIYLTIMQHL